VTAATGRRPANRPSRRADIVSAATELFTLQAPEMVTVADIADRAGMTSAAFYYHFTSKEELLEELVAEFAQEWVEAVTAIADSISSADELSRLVDESLSWIDEHEQQATVFFLTAVGATATVDATRQETRNALINTFTNMARKIAPTRVVAQPEMSAVALVSLFNTASRSRLALDDVFRTLGPAKFRAEVSALAHSIVVPTPAAKQSRGRSSRARSK
jgi:AcrR family transcriptional regulator